MQSVESILIPLTVADDVVSSEVQIESQLLDISDVETIENVVPTESLLTGTLEGQEIPEWATSTGTTSETGTVSEAGATQAHT